MVKVQVQVSDKTVLRKDLTLKAKLKNRFAQLHLKTARGTVALMKQLSLGLVEGN